MNAQELKDRMTTLDKEGRLKLVITRDCKKADIEGLRKIIRDNIEISGITVVAIKPFGIFVGCTETFFTTDDEEFNKFGREEILQM